MRHSNTWIQQFNINNGSEDFHTMLQQINSNLWLRVLSNELDIENTNVTITYKIEHKITPKRTKLKILGPYSKITEKEEHKQCSICLDHFKKGKYKRKMPNCRHEFHKKCIDEWLYKDEKFSCPVCRQFQGNNN